MANNISAKELGFLEDQLANEQLLVKKFNMLAEDTTDPTIQKKCKSIAQKHQSHYDTLYKHLS